MTPKRSPWLVWLAAALVLALTLSAGVWQLGRADAKREAASQRLALEAQPPLRQAQWPCVPGQPPLAAHRPVELQGRWWPGRTVFLDNRPMAGRSGFFVLTPLRLAGPGACAGRVVIVQRGWVPRDVFDRQRLPAWREPDVEVRLSGRVMPQPSRTYSLGAEAMPKALATHSLRQNVDDAFWQAWLGQAPLAQQVLQVQAETPVNAVAASGLAPPDMLRQWPAPDLGVDKHLAYAAQWFAMAAVTVGLLLWFRVLRPRRLGAERSTPPVQTQAPHTPT